MAKKDKTEEEVNPDLARAKAIHEASCITINGNEYKILDLTHRTRLKVFSFSSVYETQALAANFTFIDTSKYLEIEAAILNNISYNGAVVGSDPEFFNAKRENTKAGDYIELILTMMDVFSYPLLTGSLTN